MEEKTFQIYGYSVGDRSVGIPLVEFCLDTGIPLESLDEQDKLIFQERNISINAALKTIKKRLEKNKGYNKKLSYIQLLETLLEELIYELHDNGKVIIDNNLLGGEDGN